MRARDRSRRSGGTALIAAFAIAGFAAAGLAAYGAGESAAARSVTSSAAQGVDIEPRSLPVAYAVGIPGDPRPPVPPPAVDGVRTPVLDLRPPPPRELEHPTVSNEPRETFKYLCHVKDISDAAAMQQFDKAVAQLKAVAPLEGLDQAEVDAQVADLANKMLYGSPLNQTQQAFITLLCASA